MTQLGEVSNFSHKLFQIMDRIEYRRIISAEDFEDVSNLRKKAYVRAGMHVPLRGGIVCRRSRF